MTVPVTSTSLMDTYPASEVTFVEGRGVELFDDKGRRYLDFLSGLAVASLGHAHPEVTAAIRDQAGRLIHVSNLFGTLPGPDLSSAIDELVGGGGQVFFSNSGAEANEAALKLARKWAGPHRYVVLTASGSFHGRTLATLHATGQPAKHTPFQPLPEGFRHVPWNDLAAMGRAMNDDVAAVLLESVQGEGGIWPAEPDYLRGVERLCRETGVLFMVDEIQSGMARTGDWFAFQGYGVTPDVVTIAKALGNGVPIGATWARREVAQAFGPGDHGSTFGGQPLATAAGLRVIEVMREMDAPTRAREAGDRLRSSLESLGEVKEVRGRGLLLAAELASPVAKLVTRRALTAGLVVNAVTESALRFTPPLVVTNEEIDEAVAILKGILP